MKLTPWISCTKEPARIGEYEVRNVRHRNYHWRASFNGYQWHNVASGKFMNHTAMAPFEYEWRGLAKDPNA